MYDIDEYDVAGFTVGCVEKSKMIDGSKTKAGDVVIGLKSSGVHSNGFSLVRKIIFKDHNLDLNEKYTLSRTLGESLLEPTRIYVRPVVAVLDEVDVHGVAHITGGGFYENIDVLKKAWVLRLIREAGIFRKSLDSFRKPAIFPNMICIMSSTWVLA